jgi:acetyl-CoA acyltransferase
MSLTPRGGAKPAPNPLFVENWPEVYLTMGLTAERMHRKYGVSREDSDVFSLRSHQNALSAQSHGHFADEIVPIEVQYVSPGNVDRSVFDRDEGPRADTTLEALAKLTPAFQAPGTVTPAKSSQTSE